MTSIRQKIGPHVSRFFARFVESCHWSRRAARCGNTIKSVGLLGKDNYPVAVPCTAQVSSHVCQGLRGTACELDLLELRSAGEKPDKTTVRRPERVSRILGSRQRLGG